MTFPLFPVFYADSATKINSAVMGIDGILILVGGLLFRYSLLKAGVYASLL